MNWSQLHSLVFSSLIASLYPASLYVWPNLNHHNRDDPFIIKRNIASITVALIISLKSLVIYKQWCEDGGDSAQSLYRSSFQYLNFITYNNWWSFVYRSILVPVFAVVILFAGPLIADLKQLLDALPRCPYNQSRWKQLARLYGGQMYQYCFDLIIIRNLVISPITEELVFRGILLSILAPFWSKTMAILISSILFGAMHLHYFLSSVHWTEWFRLNPAHLKCTYTTLFGIYASIEYLHSGQIITPILLHAYCNLNGVPNFRTLLTNRLVATLTIGGVLFFGYHIVNVCNS